jgi:hypothetical protein
MFAAGHHESVRAALTLVVKELRIAAHGLAAVTRPHPLPPDDRRSRHYLPRFPLLRSRPRKTIASPKFMRL